MTTFVQHPDGYFVVCGIVVPEDVFMDEHPDFPELPEGAITRYSLPDDSDIVCFDGTSQLPDPSMDAERWIRVFKRKKEQYRAERLVRYPRAFMDPDITAKEQDDRMYEAFAEQKINPEEWFKEVRVQRLVARGERPVSALQDRRKWLLSKGDMSEEDVDLFIKERVSVFSSFPPRQFDAQVDRSFDPPRDRREDRERLGKNAPPEIRFRRGGPAGAR